MFPFERYNLSLRGNVHSPPWYHSYHSSCLLKDNKEQILFGQRLAPVTIQIVETAEAAIAGAPSGGQFAPGGLPSHTNLSQGLFVLRVYQWTFIV